MRDLGQEDRESLQLWQVLSLALLFVGGKSIVILNYLPSMWIWGDEMLYYATAYDLLNWGRAGVPHPGFLNYPPLTSLVISPVHLLNIPNELGYRAALILINVVQALGVIAGYLIVHELFNLRSRLLVLLLLIGPPAYMGLCLMSETPFVALYLWLLYFYIRQLKTGRARYAVAVGITIGLMVLTRKIGIGLLGSLICGMAFSLLSKDDKQYQRDNFRLHSVALIIAGGIAVFWKLALSFGFETKHGYYDSLGYIRHGLLPALAQPDGILGLARKFSANLGYVSLSTFGICVPLIIWFVLARWKSSGERDRNIKQALVFVLSFAAIAAFAAAVHMFINKSNPNPRYHMYGRYMEYFSAPLLALAFGLVMRKREWSLSERRKLTAIAMLVSVVVVLSIPSAFYARTLVKNTLAPNYMGTSWLFGLSGGSSLIIMILGPAVAVGLALLISSKGFSRREIVKMASYLLVFALAATNLGIAGAIASEKSRRFQSHYGAVSSFIRNEPETFSDGLFIDLRKRGKKDKRADRLLARKTVVDNLDKVIAGRRPQEYLGKVPVMTRRRFKKYELLYRHESSTYKIYGTKKIRRKSVKEERAE